MLSIGPSLPHKLLTILDSVLDTPAQIPEPNANPVTTSHTPPILQPPPDAIAATPTADSSAVHAMLNGAATGLAVLLDQIQQGQAPDGGPDIQSLVRAARAVNEDSPMGGTQDQPPIVIPTEMENPSPIPSRTLLEDYSAIKDVYLLVKLFDVRTQTLKALGPYLVPKQDKIGETLERLNLTNAEKPYEIYCDEGGEVRSGRLKTDRTFEMEELRHGAVLVVKEKLSSDKYVF